MTLIRPEIRFALRRWRDVLIGFLVTAIGARWVFGLSGGVLHWLGYGVFLLGLCLCVLGYRRARLLKDGAGLGVVDVTERQITYLAPDSGGVLAIDDLTHIWIAPDPRAPFDGAQNATPSWVLQAHTGQISIPADASGAEQLVDALSVLPGIDMGKAAQTMSSPAGPKILIWQKVASRPAGWTVH